MITEEQVIHRFRSLLICRDDCYCRHDGKTWEQISGPITDDVILGRLTRRECIALAPAKNWALIWAAIHFDAQGLRPKQSLHEDVLGTLDRLDHHGIAGRIVESGRGYHLWLFLEDACSAKATEVLLERVREGDHAVYAGQRPVRLPLGAHHDDRSVFCCFLDGDFQPIRDQRDHLMNAIAPVSTAALQEAYERSRGSGVQD